ncbi:MAG: hypothetical protein LQ352_002414 [Teloschistes flavicans]|nr:MAG: hypothetical protein LQ352_002414 [Teloschistes flavicans]
MSAFAMTTTAPAPRFHLLPRRQTVTVTETTTIKTFYVSFATETLSPVTLTNTVYNNVTIYSNIYSTLTHQATMTVHQDVDRPVTATVCPHPTAPQGAKTTFEPVSIIHPANQLSAGAIVGIVVGALAGLALLLGMVWSAIRKWRQWKAKKSQRMQGVELQRAWEREEETGRVLGELAKHA